MTPLLPVAALLIVAGWLALRRAFGAKLAGTGALLLAADLAPLAGLWLWLMTASGRPVTSALTVLALILAGIRGDAAKRAASNEPLVFSDAALIGIVFHPQLYAEFITPAALGAGIAAAAGALGLLCATEPPLWPVSGGLPIAAGLAACAACVRPRHATRLTADRPCDDPARNMAELGPLAGTLVHAAVARAERDWRRGGMAPGASAALPAADEAEGPIVLLQLESFFDARRLGPRIPPVRLPGFDRCVARAFAHGRFDAPAYGANTVRTEFAALTGQPPSALGLDRFNPYAAFARAPVDSVAWRLRALGYRTVCIHPFDGGFYGRRRILPNLGFEEFIDIAGFGPCAGGGGYVSDMALVRMIARVLRKHGPRVFVFGISIGNHSPWAPPPGLPHGASRQQAALAGVLRGHAETDAALGAMAGMLQDDWPDGLLAAYGDHQPCLPMLQERGWRDRSTDYVLWRPRGGLGRRRDIAAHELPGMLLTEAAAGLAKPQRAATG